MLREKNAEATIISTPWEELGKDAVLHALQHGAEIEGILEEHAHEHDDHEHHHHHDDECGCGHDHDHDHHHDHEEHEHHHDHDHEEHEHHHDHDHECGCGCGHHHHDHEGHHHADDVFTSWGKETIRTYTKEEIGNILKTLEEDGSYGNILRAKGMVADVNGSWIYFDMVPGEYEIREGEPDYTGRLCVIGTHIDEHRLEELFGIA